MYSRERVSTYKELPVILKRKLPAREEVFLCSLRYHGFRTTFRRSNLKYRLRYIIPSTEREDSNGIDFWIKMSKSHDLIPIQVTQRGIRLLKKHGKVTEDKLPLFEETSNERLRSKQERCKNDGVAFVLVRDFDGKKTNPTLAWGDVKALLYAVREHSQYNEMQYA